MIKPRKINKLKVSVTIFFIIFAITTAVFGRYIFNGVKDTYLSARQFYFTSNILTMNGAKYEFNNWGGVDAYPIELELYSYKNELSKLDYDLNYKITCESLTTSKISCGIGSVDGATSSSGTIKVSENNTKKIIVYVKPLVKINEGETVKLRITASTEEPYKKQLSCEISLRVTPKVTYSIDDTKYRDYAVLKLANDNNVATSITLQFDPIELRIDSNDEFYKNMTIVKTINISNKTYVSEVKFELPADSDKNIKFYKVTTSNDYTYPNEGATCAIDVKI